MTKCIHFSKWVWVKIKVPGDRRFWSMFPFTRLTFWVPNFDPQPVGETQNSGHKTQPSPGLARGCPLCNQLVLERWQRKQARRPLARAFAHLPPKTLGALGGGGEGRRKGLDELHLRQAQSTSLEVCYNPLKMGLSLFEGTPF